MAIPPDVPVFQYQPLDLTGASLRVFTIASGPKGSIIRCQLRHIYVNPFDGNHERYTCLSYTWGDEHDTELILLNGARLSVRRNLYNFLCQARQNGLQQPLWVDAICIDQENVAERNHQVQQMSNIYSKAEQVLVWVGQVAPHLAAFVKTMWWLARRNTWGSRAFLMDCIIYLARWWRDAAMDAMAATYWGRLWPVQELILNANTYIVAGKHQVDILPFLEVTYYLTICKSGNRMRDEVNLRAQDKMRTEHFEALREVRTAFQKGKIMPDFLELLAKFPRLQCKENKDHIYGLLGMCREGSSIDVRYDESDFETLFRVLSHVRVTGGLQNAVVDMARVLRVAYRICCGQCAQSVPGSLEALYRQEIQDFCAKYTTREFSRLALLVVSSKMSQLEELSLYNLSKYRGHSSSQATRCSHCPRRIPLDATWSPMAARTRRLWFSVPKRRVSHLDPGPDFTLP
ncbi:hypothetical protein H2200_006510 [Cladophialophora chaetospira]|uniref:Heterokaryon incompatibility domain-containing protein n=1 Tax=Cladophialophora chaetospira TaxID=386627 RepID=A0AA38X8X9_9EURO|nr:hypothetical protein H2200_006510 [Cladophialophora chaetospira]